MGLWVGAFVLAAAVTALASPVDAHAQPDHSASSVAVRVAARAPDGTVPVRAAQTTRCSAGLVALTFDDGPARGLTAKLVGILEDLHVPATFFMVGSRVRTAPHAARVVAHAGFKIGNPTWSHARLTTLSARGIRRELRRTARELRSVGITPSTLMRPPYGEIDARVRAVVSDLGLYPVLWTVDSDDWRGGTAQQIASSILRQLRPHRTNIVLQHDGVPNSPASVAAVPIVVRTARRRGYCFARLGRQGQVVPPVPSVDAKVLQGNEAGPVPARVELSLSTPTSRPVSVRVRTTSGTASAGEDFVATTVRVRFPTGSTRASVDVPVIDDDLYEPVEDFHVILDSPYRLTVARADHLGTILSDDPPVT